MVFTLLLSNSTSCSGERTGGNRRAISSAVSDFFFEFEPEQDIARFLQHAHFGGIAGGRLIACREDLLGVADLTDGEPIEQLPVDLASELPAPFRFTPDCGALDGIARDDQFRGRVTVCSCGIAGCFSQYVWVRESLCLALFTINGASLSEVMWRPFRFVVQAKPDGVLSSDDP